MCIARLQNALERLSAAIYDVQTELAAMEAEHDPLASHIFVSRRHYQNLSDTKSGKRRAMSASKRGLNQRPLLFLTIESDADMKLRARPHPVRHPVMQALWKTAAAISTARS